jgi:hypothetical protein
MIVVSDVNRTDSARIRGGRRLDQAGLQAFGLLLRHHEARSLTQDLSYVVAHHGFFSSSVVLSHRIVHIRLLGTAGAQVPGWQPNLWPV